MAEAREGGGLEDRVEEVGGALEGVALLDAGIALGSSEEVVAGDARLTFLFTVPEIQHVTE